MIITTKYFSIINASKKPSCLNVKYILLCIIEPLLKAFVRLTWKKSEPKKYYLSICAIFKNEAQGMKEFIEYHLLQGVEHFYMYNNNSDDNYAEVLKPYIEKGIVTYVEWPPIPGQLPMYKHWYANYRNESNWCAFIDMDEFFVPYYENTFAQWLHKHDRYPLLQVYWKMFGSSGRMEHDETKLVTEQYFNSWDKLTNKGKIIYNTSYDISFFKLDMMHYFMVNYKGIKMPPINPFGHFTMWNINRAGNKKNDIQLNHYWSKAYGNYEKKHQRGSAVFGKSWKTFDKFMEYEHNNITSDFKIFRFLIQLKLKMTGKYPQ